MLSMPWERRPGSVPPSNAWERAARGSELVEGLWCWCCEASKLGAFTGLLGWRWQCLLYSEYGMDAWSKWSPFLSLWAGGSRSHGARLWSLASAFALLNMRVKTYNHGALLVP